MSIQNKNLSCLQVDEIGTAVKHYEDLGCTSKMRSKEGCATVDCPDIRYYVCEKGKGESHSLDSSGL